MVGIIVVYFKRKLSRVFLNIPRQNSSSLLLGTGTLLGQQHRLDVGQDTTLGNGHTSQELIQFLIIPESIKSKVCKEGQKLPDGKLKMPGDDARLLVVSGSVASQLQDLCSQIFHHCSHAV